MVWKVFGKQQTMGTTLGSISWEVSDYSYWLLHRRKLTSVRR